MAEQVIALCREQELFIATAESLTGGLLASELISIPGASDVVLGSVVAYRNVIKQQLLGVSAQLIANQGTVDAEVCAQMAQGVREKFAKASALDVSSVIGVSTTGLAGPEDSPGFTNVTPGVRPIKSSTLSTPAFSRVAPVKAVTDPGTSRIFSALRRAVTIISSSKLASFD